MTCFYSERNPFSGWGGAARGRLYFCKGNLSGENKADHNQKKETLRLYLTLMS